MLFIYYGVYTAADNKQISVLIGLDLSAAFDTVDHSLLIERLQLEFGVNDMALDWLRSYLVDRIQFVHEDGTASVRQTRLRSTSAFRRGLYSARCYLPCTAVRWVT